MSSGPLTAKAEMKSSAGSASAIGTPNEPNRSKKSKVSPARPVPREPSKSEATKNDPVSKFKKIQKMNAVSPNPLQPEFSNEDLESALEGVLAENPTTSHRRSRNSNSKSNNNATTVRGGTPESNNLRSIWQSSRVPSFKGDNVEFYRVFQRRTTDTLLTIPVTLIACMVVATRFNLGKLGETEGSGVFSAAFVFLVISCVMALIQGIADLVDKLFDGDSAVYDALYDFSENVIRKWFYGCFEDMLYMNVTITTCLYLIARVVSGPCPEGTSVWESQSCNPYADMGGVPAEHVVLLYALPLVFQNWAASFRAVVGMWVIILFSVLFSVCYAGAANDLWLVLYFVLFFCVSYDRERRSRKSFLRALRAIEAKKRQVAILKMQKQSDEELQRKMHDMEMLGVTAENEKRLREAESFQLRSLMGNVAHDLKTPLFSFEADVETLKTFFKYLPPNSIKGANEMLKRKSGGLAEEIKPNMIFESLFATCRFMALAINRSQDYMKASSDIALVPSLETFNVKTVVDMSVRCIRHLYSDRKVIFHPMPPDICSHVISDKHWIGENVLCLLSNAAKYSDDGDIELTIELVVDSDASAFVEPDKKVSPENDEEGSIVGGSASEGGDRRSGGRRSSGGKGSGSRGGRRSGVGRGSGGGDEESISSARIHRAESIVFKRANLKCKRVKEDAVSVTIRTERTAKRYRSMKLGNQQSNKMILVTVEDHGIGIPEDKRQNLFQPFKQAQRMTGGTGLGLYSLAKRMEALGGSCGVAGRSDGSQGSLFYFSFPYRPDDSAAEDAVRERVQRQESAMGMSGIKEEDERDDYSNANSATTSIKYKYETETLSAADVEVGAGAGAGIGAGSGPETGGRGGRASGTRASAMESLKKKVEDARVSMESRSKSGLIGSPIATVNIKRPDVRIENQLSTLMVTTATAVTAAVVSDKVSTLSDRQPQPQRELIVGDVAAGAVAGTGASFITGTGASAADESQKLNGLKILLVDDTASILKVAGRLLRMNGHQVDTASNGSRGLEALKAAWESDGFDLQLSDLQMPVMDGFEATRRFRAWEEEQQQAREAHGVPRKRRFLIVGMSANSDSMSKQEALDSGMDFFVAKPFAYKDLQPIILNYKKEKEKEKEAETTQRA